MSEALRELAAVQFGIETTPGTPVAADTVLLGTNMDVQEMIDRRVLEEPRGVLADYETVDVGKGTMFAYEGYADYEQILLPLLTGLDGTAAGVDQGTGGPYLWAFEPTYTAAEALKAATLEWIQDDGAAEHIEREAAYLTCSGMELSIPLSGLSMLRANYFARASQSSTVTASQSPLARTLIPGELWTVEIRDDSTFDGTAYSGHIRQATLAVNFGVTPKRSLKGRTDLDFTGLNRNKITGTLAMRLELDANAGDSNELGDWRSGTKRFVRLKATNGTKIAQFDVCIIVVDRPVISMEDGVAIVEFTGRIFYDATWAKAIHPQITNSLSTF